MNLQSHNKALKAQAEGKFDKQIVPITVDKRLSMKMVKRNQILCGN
jgi:acetyl-CoA acetyltransferase